VDIRFVHYINLFDILLEVVVAVVVWVAAVGVVNLHFYHKIQKIVNH
jgi:hypothetical protein